MGTESYFSPELENKQKNINWSKSDAYSLGLTLFECLTLKRVSYLRNLSENEIKEELKIVKKSKFLKTIIPLMIEKDKSKRFSFKELMDKISQMRDRN